MRGRGGSEGTRAEALKFRFPLSAHSPPSQYWHLHPRGEECWSKRGWSRHSSWTGAHAGEVVGNWLELWAISICFLCLALGSKEAYVCSSRAESRFLTPFLLVSIVFRPAKETPGVRAQGWGVPICGLNCSLPREDLWACVIPLLFCVPSQGYRSQPDRFSSLLPNSVWFYLYSFGCVRVFLPVSNLFSVRIAPPVDVGLMYS